MNQLFSFLETINKKHYKHLVFCEHMFSFPLGNTDNKMTVKMNINCQQFSKVDVWFYNLINNV